MKQLQNIQTGQYYLSLDLYWKYWQNINNYDFIYICRYKLLKMMPTQEVEFSLLAKKEVFLLWLLQSLQYKTRVCQ